MENLENKINGLSREVKDDVVKRLGEKYIIPTELCDAGMVYNLEYGPSYDAIEYILNKLEGDRDERIGCPKAYSKGDVSVFLDNYFRRLDKNTNFDKEFNTCGWFNENQFKRIWWGATNFGMMPKELADILEPIEILYFFAGVHYDKALNNSSLNWDWRPLYDIVSELINDGINSLRKYGNTRYEKKIKKRFIWDEGNEIDTSEPTQLTLPL